MKKNLLFTAVVILGFTIATMAQVPNYVPTDGLVGWWPFNGNANDESSNGNNGIVNGATLTADRFGNENMAYSYNGVDNYISANIGNLTSITFSFWYKANQPELDWSSFFMYNQVYCQEAGLGSSPNNFGKIYARKQLPTDAYGVLSPSVPTYNEWHHVVFTANSTNDYS